MSTRGWFIFKYKGKYYVFYNHADSYPDIPYGLCSRLIEELKKYNLEQLIELIDNFILLINEDKKYDDYNRDIHYNSIEETLKNPNHEYKIIEEIHKKDIMIEYKYIINLDEELFTMTNEWHNIQLHFPLFNIPNDWYDFYCKVLEAYQLEE